MVTAGSYIALGKYVFVCYGSLSYLKKNMSWPISKQDWIIRSVFVQGPWS